MRKLMMILAVLAFADKAMAMSYCYTYGKNTYCDDGTSYHRYGNVITEVKPSGEPINRYRTFDDATYGNGDEWVAKHSDGTYTSSGLRGKTRQVLPDLLDRDADSSGGYGDGESDE